MKKKKNKYYFFIGTTAELIKLAPVIHEFKKRKIPIKVISSGQHILHIKEIPKPLDNITIYKSYPSKGNKSSSIGFFLWAVRTLFVSLYDLRSEFTDKKNTYFLLHGDTVTSLIGAIIARIYGLKLVHIESGLRSFNFFEPFPEELCRYFVSKLTNIHFCPNDWSVKNLQGYKGEKINTYQNTSTETLSHAINVKKKFNRISHIKKPYFVLVVHRQEHVIFRKTETEKMIRTIFQNIDKNLSCILIGHDLTMKFISKTGLSSELEKQNVIVLPRLSYIEFIHLLKDAEYILTDGGSNQEEAYYLGKPCLVLRNRTERIEGIDKNVILLKKDNERIVFFLKNLKKLNREQLRVGKSPSGIIVDALNT